MGRYLVHRIAFSFFSLFLLIGFGFFLVRQLPGNPFAQDETLDPAVVAEMSQQMGLDRPLWNQYLSYLGDLLQGHLGVSIQSPSQKVVELIVEAFHWTLILATWSLLLAVILSLCIGIGLTVKARSKSIFNALSLMIFCMPAPVAAPLLVGIFALGLGWFPLTRVDNWAGWILPIFIVALRPTFKLARVLVTEMERVLASDSIRTFRSLGFSEFKIRGLWALRESLVAYVSYLGTVIVDLMAGSLLVEIMFGIPGLGFRLGDAISSRDYLVLSGIILVTGVLVLLIQLIVDLILFWLDPRLRDDVIFQTDAR